MSKVDKTPVIGIDLGTNSSLVSVFRDGKVEIIIDDLGTKSIPNCVAFTEIEHLIGPAAVKQANVNPRNTIFIAKRLIGRCFNEISFIANGKHCPLILVCSSINKALIQVEYRRFVRYFCPEEITSFVLRRLKEKAEKYLDCKVKNVVVTVPANFNDAQRQATVDAARIAGLHVMKLLNEPTAVALAYGLEKDISDEKNIMIFDLGASSFDVSIISIEQRTRFRVKATAGSSFLGGIDFDNKLVDYFVEEFNNQNEKDIRQSIYSITRLHTVCEQIKRTLSFTTEASVELKSLFDDIDFTLVISRETFETICSDLFKSILGFAEKALREAKLEKYAIDDVVLVGGSARIPMIQKSLQDFMHGKKLNTFINPDEVVAYGAAVQAAVFSEDVDNVLNDITVVDVNPLSIGIESCGGVMTKLIHSNSTLPFEISNVFTTTFDDQSSLIFRIFEGERLMTKDNHCLGRFELSNIPSAPKETPQIKVRFRMDVNGIIHLSVAGKSSDTFNKIKFFFDKGRLIIEEILKMSNDAEKFKIEDEKERQRHAARSKLEEYLLYVKERVEPDTYKLTEKERLTAIAQYQEIFFWIDKTPFLNPNHYNKKLEEATRIFFYVIEKLNAPSPTPPLPSSTPSKTGSSRSQHSSSSHRKESLSPTGTSAASSPSATSSREKFA